MSDLHALSASAMVAAYRDGSLSPVEVTQAVLQHIERCEPVLCATYALDAEAALSMARAAEARWHAGTPISVGGVCIDGVPATIKENIATRGVPVPVGTAASLPVSAAADAARRWLQAPGHAEPQECARHVAIVARIGRLAPWLIAYRIWMEAVHPALDGTLSGWDEQVGAANKLSSEWEAVAAAIADTMRRT